MKTSRSTTLWTVAMAATAMSIPIMMKRGDPAGFFDCIVNSLKSGKWQCDAAIMSMDLGIVTNVMVMPLTIEIGTQVGAEFKISSSSLQANVISPPAVLGAWPLTQSKERADLVYNGKKIASFETAMSPTTVAGNKVSSVLPPADLSIIVGAENDFSTFIAGLLELKSVAFRLTGTLDATLQLPAGLPPTPTAFNILGLAFDSPITLAGCDGFPGIKFSQLISFTQDAASKKYTLVAQISINNPSDLVVKLGELSFLTTDANGKPIGTSVFKDFHLERGLNTLTVTTTAEAANLDGLLTPLTTTGGTFRLSGAKESSKSQLLANGLLNFEVTIEVPKLPKPSSA